MKTIKQILAVLMAFGMGLVLGNMIDMKLSEVTLEHLYSLYNFVDFIDVIIEYLSG